MITNCKYKALKFSFLILIVFLNITIYNVFASGKPKIFLLNHLSISENLKQKFYTEKEIEDFEKESGIKIPEISKEIYTKKTSIKDLIFTNRTNNQIFEIYEIFPLKGGLDEDGEEISSVELYCGINFEIDLPTEDSIPFGKCNYCDTVYISDGRLWIYDRTENCFTLLEISKK